MMSKDLYGIWWIIISLLVQDTLDEDALNSMKSRMLK